MSGVVSECHEEHSTVALGGVSVSEKLLIRFGIEETAACATGASVIRVDEQDFNATYDPTTNSWMAMWKWLQSAKLSVLHNQVEEYFVAMKIEQCMRRNWNSGSLMVG
ncbi:hypothetical protein O3P69_016990 [Scylla paramamosain]|uniref:Uncharacterized protein n=1 Tax=Scylla paramamosain TaxID=85552 RepID=A0AAW0TV59_SCYPA